MQQTIDTPRLTLLRLDADTMRMLAQPDGQAWLEAHMGLAPAPDEAAKAFATEYCARLAAEDGGWYRFWYFIGRAETAIVGGALFKGGPDEQGVVEIGYGLSDGFHGCGYATEAVGPIVRWALAQPGVCAVVAETERDNTASHRVLYKTGFRLTHEAGGCYWWRIE